MNKCATYWPYVLVTIAYLLCAKLGQQLAVPPGIVSPLWPPAGISLAAILWLGYKLWPAVFLGSFLHNCFPLWPAAWHTTPQLFTASLFIGGGAALQAVAGAYLLRRLTRSNDPFKSLYQAFVFLFFSAIIASCISSTIGTTALFTVDLVSSQQFNHNWLAWWLGDCVGVVTLTPTIMAWYKKKFLRINRIRALELSLLIILLCFFSYITFFVQYPFAYILILFPIWGALRGGQRLSTLTGLFISAMAILGAIKGYRQLGGHSVEEAIMLLQAFVAMLFITDLFLSALLSEREQVHLKLKEANVLLEWRVDARTKDLQAKNSELLQAMQRLQQTQAMLVQAEKMSSLGILIAGIAHEINNPINFVCAGVPAVKENIEELFSERQLSGSQLPAKSAESLQYLKQDTWELLNCIQEGADRAAAIIKDLRTFARLEKNQKQKTDIHECLDSTLSLLHHRCKERITIVKNYAHIPPFDCYPGKLKQVFMNVISNAIDAIRDTGTITITTSQEGGEVYISIKDSGQGMAEETMHHMFEPFFTTKEVGAGTGLGLAVSYGIVEEHGGHISVQSQLGEGSEFIISLPYEAR